jgi:hypothetical protein
VLTSDVAKRLLPERYSGKINLEMLATQVGEASDLGNRSLEALSELTARNSVIQIVQSGKINSHVKDSLTAIHKLSEAQIGLQAITAELNQNTLLGQDKIYRLQQDVETSHGTLAQQLHEIEKLITGKNSTDLIEELVGDIEVIGAEQRHSADRVQRLATQFSEEVANIRDEIIKSTREQQNCNESKHMKLMVLLVLIAISQMGVIGYLVLR